MKNKLDFRYYDAILIAIIFLASFWLQQHLYFNWDASWHLEAAKRIVEGGASYSKNLFDDNLPMVFWFFIPPVLVHNITGIFLITLCNLYVYIFVLINFLLCNIYLKEIYAQSKYWEFQIVRYVLLLSLLFFPGSEFAQRDMLVTTFVFPYIILMAARTTARENLHFHNGFVDSLLGLFAAIAIAMNPYYGLIIIVLEVQFWISAKKIMLWRPEIMTFIVAYLIYLLGIGLLYPDYYTEVIPSYLAFSPAYNASIRELISSYAFFYAGFATLVFFTMTLTMGYRQWLRTLWLCIVVGYIVYFVNGKLWLSHTIFLVVSANLFFSIVACQCFALTKNRMKNFALGILSFYILLFLITLSYFTNFAYYKSCKDKKSMMNQLISFFNQQPKNSTVFLLSTRSIPMFPVVDYISMHYLSPWPDCWAIREIAKSENDINKMIGWKKKRVIQYKKIFVLQIVSIMQSQKPTYVVVDISKDQGNLKKQFHFIEYLSQNADFRQAWKHYYLKKTIANYAVYEYHPFLR